MLPGNVVCCGLYSDCLRSRRERQPAPLLRQTRVSGQSEARIDAHPKTLW